MRLFELMSTDVETIGTRAAADAAYDEMRRRNIHHLVVVEGGDVVGVVSDGDLGGRAGAEVRRTCAVGDVMTPDPVVAAPDTTVREAANLLRGRSVGCLPILDAGHLVGIVTITDLLEMLGRGVDRPSNAHKRTTLRQSPARAWKSVSR